MSLVARNQFLLSAQKYERRNESKRELPSVLGIDNAEYSNVDVANTNVLREYKLGITRTFERRVTRVIQKYWRRACTGCNIVFAVLYIPSSRVSLSPRTCPTGTRETDTFQRLRNKSLRVGPPYHDATIMRGRVACRAEAKCSPTSSGRYTQRLRIC